VLANPAREWGRNATVIKVKPRIPDACFGLFYRSLRCALIARALVNVLKLAPG